MIPGDMASLCAFLLVLARMSGLLLASPLLGQRQFPAMAKAALVLVLAVGIAPLAAVPREAARLDVSFALRLVVEVMVGLMLGYLFHAALLAVTMAGQFMDFEMGFGLAQVFDPSFGVHATVLSRFYYLLALVVFVYAGGHRMIFLALAASYRAIPAGGMEISGALLPAALRALSDVFLQAVKVGAPVIGALLVADVIFGIVARAVPQLNVFVIGFPLKILLGLAAVAVTLPFTVTFIGDLVQGLESLLVRAF